MADNHEQIVPDAEVEQIDPQHVVEDQIEPENNVEQEIANEIEMNGDEETPMLSSYSKDVELWINVQEVIYRNMGESSSWCALISALAFVIAAVVVTETRNQDGYKLHVVLLIMMFFYGVLFCASLTDVISCNMQSFVFKNKVQICNWKTCWKGICPSRVFFWKYIDGFRKSFIPSLIFPWKAVLQCSCDRPHLWNSTVDTSVKFSGDISLWLFMQSSAVKKTSLINLFVSLISFVSSIVCCILAGCGVLLNEKLMTVTALAFYFLGSGFYTLAESFSYFVQAAILANVGMEKDFISKLKRFLKFIIFNCCTCPTVFGGYRFVQALSPERRISREQRRNEEAHRD